MSDLENLLKEIRACRICEAHLPLPPVIGQHAQVYFLGAARKKTLTDTVRAWEEYAPRYFPLPHPSPRNTAWFVHNPWFDAEVLPALRKRVAAALQD